MWNCVLLILLGVSSIFTVPIEGEDNSTISSIPVENRSQKYSGRIVNGSNATLGQFPFQVSLRRKSYQNHFCGGSIVAPTWVLSAAHCMFNEKSKRILSSSILVVAGEIALYSTKKARQWSLVTNIIVHPEYDTGSLVNDIALLRLETPLVFDPYVRPIRVPFTEVKSGSLCKVAGWGYPAYGVEIISNVLKYVEVPVISTSLCRKLYAASGIYVAPCKICAGYSRGGKDACQGDSGGGLVCGEVITGIVSSGKGCAWAGFPGMYTNVTQFRPWIGKYVDLSRNYTHRNESYRRSNSSPSILLSSSLCYVLAVIWYIMH